LSFDFYRLNGNAKLISGKVKTKPQKQTGGLKLDMDFDEAMRRALRVKPVKQSSKPPAKRKN
jgi:hypothetical protein